MVNIKLEGSTFHTLVRSARHATNPHSQINTRVYTSRYLQPTYFNTISPEFGNIVKYCNENAWLAGGCLVDAQIGLSPKDYDFFFHDEDAYYSTIRSMLKDGHTIVNRDQGGTMIEMSNKAQLIGFKFFESASHAIDSFDLGTCHYAYDGVRWYYSCDYIRDRKLRLHKIGKPQKTLSRYIKYYNKGFHNVTFDDLYKIVGSVFSPEKVDETWSLYKDAWWSGIPVSDASSIVIQKLAPIIKPADQEMRAFIIKVVRSCGIDLDPCDIIKLRAI